MSGETMSGEVVRYNLQGHILDDLVLVEWYLLYYNEEDFLLPVFMPVTLQLPYQSVM